MREREDALPGSSRGVEVRWAGRRDDRDGQQHGSVVDQSRREAREAAHGAVHGVLRERHAVDAVARVGGNAANHVAERRGGGGAEKDKGNRTTNKPNRVRNSFHLIRDSAAQRSASHRIASRGREGIQWWRQTYLGSWYLMLTSIFLRAKWAWISDCRYLPISGSFLLPLAAGQKGEGR